MKNTFMYVLQFRLSVNAVAWSRTDSKLSKPCKPVQNREGRAQRGTPYLSHPLLATWIVRPPTLESFHGRNERVQCRGWNFTSRLGCQNSLLLGRGFIIHHSIQWQVGSLKQKCSKSEWIVLPVLEDCSLQDVCNMFLTISLFNRHVF